MHLKYHDILQQASTHPLWWLDGVPRYEPFSPELAGRSEVALVHTECQECGTRYDVAVRPRPPFFHSLRTVLAYTTDLNIGDPPFACNVLGAKRCLAGYSMNSLEIRVLEFWYRPKLTETTTLAKAVDILKWRRDSDFELELYDGHLNVAGQYPDTVFERIYNSGQNDEWHRLREQGDFPAMVKLLTAFGCERPAEVAHMFDLDRRGKAFLKEMSALRHERLGKSQ